MPMEFELTEEQQQVKRMVREFAEAEIKPHVMEWDEPQHFPKELFPKMGALGLMGVIFPGRIWRRRDGLHRVRDDHRGAFARGWFHRLVGGRA